MKRVILIWIGVIVAVILVGVVVKSCGDAKKPKEPEYTEVVVGTDEEGNDIKEKVMNKPITVEQYGETYTYNPYLWLEKDIKIGNTAIPQTTVYSEIEKLNLSHNGTTFFDGNGNVFYMGFNKYTDTVRNIEAYTQKYYDILLQTRDGAVTDCVLPCNIILDKTTFNEVQNIYGKCHTFDEDEKIKSLMYYEKEDGGTSLILYFDKETDIVIGFKLTY